MEACGKRGISEIPDAWVTEFLKVISYLRTKLSVPVALAMPSVQSFFASNLEDEGQPEPKDALSPGNTEVADKGQLAELFCTAHAPVPIPRSL